MYGMLLALTTSGPALGAVVLNRLAITIVEILLFGAGVASWRFLRTKRKLPGRLRFRPPHQPILSARRLRLARRGFDLLALRSRQRQEPTGRPGISQDRRRGNQCTLRTTRKTPAHAAAGNPGVESTSPPARIVNAS